LGQKHSFAWGTYNVLRDDGGGSMARCSSQSLRSKAKAAMSKATNTANMRAFTVSFAT
jgi:hypothetical protein